MKLLEQFQENILKSMSCFNRYKIEFYMFEAIPGETAE